MERWKGRVALVTGASVGIGAAIARALVQHGMKVVGCARNVDKIEDLSSVFESDRASHQTCRNLRSRTTFQGSTFILCFEKLAAECESAGYAGTLVPYKCDLTSEEEILSMFSAIKTLHQGVDVCINNAGLAHPEPLLSGRTEYWRNMIDVNVIAMSICTREAYQSMKERNIDDGHIININSLVGHITHPEAEFYFYGVRKYAVTALTKGVQYELHDQKSHIRATQIYDY
ncbi:dehydrogenase/reductase SDR family member 11a isoform X4 [Heptranchias perlo]|uniref:dehydrogenase/reductase SDR family member 11a isoform X4 n=1 Tax=Heptranchias perlo TaxID=212740 RepID=UPI00355A74B7